MSEKNLSLQRSIQQNDLSSSTISSDQNAEIGFKAELSLLRRTLPRFLPTKQIPIKFNVVSGMNLRDSLISGKIENISATGLLISTNKYFPISMNVKIKIMLSQDVFIFGKLVWHYEMSSHKSLYGVKTTANSTKDNLALLNFIDTNLSAKNAIDRRKGNRRLNDKFKIIVDKRSFDRRLKNNLFGKCIKFSHWYNYIKQNNYFLLRETSSASAARVIVKKKKMLMLGSNNYLGLSTHPKVKEAAIKAIKKYGLGSGGSRLLSGTTDLHNALEEKLAKFKGVEAGIVFTAGYMTNVGVISTLVNEGEFVIVDEKSHASIIDGTSLCNGNLRIFRHNDMESLEKELKFCGKESNKLVVTDGIFSMDGDMCKLDLIYELTQKYNAAIMIDDAHATGVIGERGSGTAEHFGLAGKIDLEIGTLSKSLGSIGGFAVASKRIIFYLKHVARSFLFATSQPPAICAAVIAAIKVIEEEPQLKLNLWRNINFLREGLIDIGYNLQESQSAILPIILGDEGITYKLAKMLEEQEIFTNAVAYPAVRKREARIRLTPMATHTLEDMETTISAFKQAGRKLRVI
ncbi:MAG: aminotransferase class I/II-fold pyridoxal phosphate-dependent enzyme [bacterium]|nr:aminotransferase class I/II-fold pyridoxal phosphate-dependent enzyme [bacterium]MDD5755851.1 aminotransferase class I/II-fold pyridoxal phosphate-dependent enzyme [bacterium]